MSSEGWERSAENLVVRVHLEPVLVRRALARIQRGGVASLSSPSLVVFISPA